MQWKMQNCTFITIFTQIIDQIKSSSKITTYLPKTLKSKSYETVRFFESLQQAHLASELIWGYVLFLLL